MEEVQKTIVRYNLTHDILAKTLVSRFEGLQPIVMVEIIDENGRLIVTEEELKKRGATFTTAFVVRDLSGAMVKKNRETGEDNPFVDTKISPKTRTATERYSIQYLLNAIWQNVVDNKREKTDGTETGYKAGTTRSNGIVNYENSRVICHKIKDGKETFYMNYVVLRYLSERIVTDENGDVIDAEWLDGFLSKSKVQQHKSREKEAKKHGIEARFDPQIRQMKMSNIAKIRVFGAEFVPTTITETKTVKV